MDSRAPSAPFTAAIVQDAPVFLNLELSLEKAARLVEQAASHGAEIIAFPETWLPGYPVWLDHAPQTARWGYKPAKALYRLLTENALTVPGPHLDRLLALAKKAGAYLVMGAHERRGGTLYNTMIFVDREGEAFAIHRKLMPTYSERLVWGRGDGSTLPVMPTAFGNLGGLICWEHWMPLARAAIQARGEVVHVAQWPSVRNLHQLASRHYAFEGQCFVLAAGSVLSQADVLAGFETLGQPDSPALDLLRASTSDGSQMLLTGGSAIIGPNSHYLAGPAGNEACILYAELDPAAIHEGHLVMDSQGHYARPDVFTLQVNDQPQENVTFRSQAG
jgi:predicted amidohydrolase